MTVPAPSSQSGALFGLDARLAIGVFAMLAVIAGYVAFGRVGIARTTALIADLRAFEEALDAYQTDMGTFFLFTLEKDPGDTGATDLEALWDKERILPGFQHLWNGPYLHRDNRQHKDFGRFTVFYAQSNRTDVCTTDSDCYVWLALTDVPAKIWNEVNRQIDEAGGSHPERPGEDTINGLIQAVDGSDMRTLIYRTVSRP